MKNSFTENQREHSNANKILNTTLSEYFTDEAGISDHKKEILTYIQKSKTGNSYL